MYGKLDVLEHIVSTDGTLSNVTTLFAAIGNCINCNKEHVHSHCVQNNRGTSQLNCLQFVHQHGGELSEFSMLCSVVSGSIDCLQYHHAHGVPWQSNITKTAAERGRLNCLRFALENGCELDTDAIYLAAKHSELDCIRYIVEAGHTVSSRIWRAVVDKPECESYLTEYYKKKANTDSLWDYMSY